MISVPSPRSANLPSQTHPYWLVLALLLTCSAPSSRLYAQDAKAQADSAPNFHALNLITPISNAAGSNLTPSANLPAPEESNFSAATSTPPADEALETNPDKLVKLTKIPRPDFNEDIYYRNKLEYSQELGVLPINIPFVFDIFIGSEYDQKPLHYTLVPVEPSLRWQMGKLNGPWFLRGNTELELSPTFTSVVRGPESRYEAFVLGFRRNFVPRNSRPTAYFDFRMGAGWIDAQEPHGVPYAQGQDFTFTLQMGSGCRYNFSPKYGMSLGFNYMHVSNLYLSEPKYPNNGINVWGPQAGFYVRLGKPKQPHAS